MIILNINHTKQMVFKTTFFFLIIFLHICVAVSASKAEATQQTRKLHVTAVQTTVMESSTVDSPGEAASHGHNLAVRDRNCNLPRVNELDLYCPGSGVHGKPRPGRTVKSPPARPASENGVRTRCC